MIEAVIDVEINITYSDDSSDNDTEDDDTTEIEQMMSEIMEEMEEIADSEENDSNSKSKPMKTMKSSITRVISNTHTSSLCGTAQSKHLHVGQFSGDPQYYFKQAEDWGYTVGAFPDDW